MEALATRVKIRHFERGALLFSEGDPCIGLFLVASGKIRIFKLSPSGREQVLAVELPGVLLRSFRCLMEEISLLPRPRWKTLKYSSFRARISRISAANTLRSRLKSSPWSARVCAAWSESSKTFHSQR